MAKGVIDGAMVPWEGVPAAKLQEIAKSHLDAPAGQPKFANSIFAFVMNQARYDALPPELKKVIDANSGLTVSAWAGEKGFDAVVAANHKLASDRGNLLLTLERRRISALDQGLVGRRRPVGQGGRRQGRQWPGPARRSTRADPAI